MRALPPILILLCLTACGDHAEEFQPLPTDIVDSIHMTQNFERLDEFVANVQSGTPDELRIVQYTIEGDPIITTLASGPEWIFYTHSNMRSPNAASRHIQTRRFTRIERAVEPDGTIAYILHGDEQLRLFDIPPSGGRSQPRQQDLPNYQ